MSGGATDWPRVKLGEVLTRSTETVEPHVETEYQEITVRMWGKGVVERGRVLGASVNGRRFVARAGQFIASRIDARNGAMGLVPDTLDGALVTNDFPLFDVNVERLAPGYLQWLCRTPSFVELCQRASEGTTNRVRLKEGEFIALEVSLPPLPEQQHIVARIDEIATQTGRAIALRHEANEDRDALAPTFTTRIVDQLSHLLTHPIRSLGVAQENPIQIGPFGAQLQSTEFASEGVPVLNVGNVWPDGLRFVSIDHVTAEKALSLARYTIRAGDLLFARSGATLGKVCIVPQKCDGWLMTGHLFRIRFDPERVLNRYAFALLRNAAQIQDLIFGQVRGATRPGYNTTLLGNVALPLPALAEQRRIISELDALQTEIDALKQAQAQTGAELDALLPAILNRAFAGAL